MALPVKARKFFGHASNFAQHGDRRDAAKVLESCGAGVLEVVEDDAGGTYRAVYTVKFEEAVFVLHCFRKESKSGIATPKEELAIIRARLKVAEAIVKERSGSRVRIAYPHTAAPADIAWGSPASGGRESAVSAPAANAAALPGSAKQGTNAPRSRNERAAPAGRGEFFSL